MDNASDIRGIACAEARLSLQAYGEERLDETRHLEVRRHLLGCDLCREAAAALHPSIIFMSPAVVSPPGLPGFDASFRSRLEAEAARKLGPFRVLLDTLRGVPRLAYAAPVLAAAILAGLMFVRPGAWFESPAEPVTQAVPSADQTPVTPDHHGRGRRLPTTADEIASLPTLEEVSSPKARVYRLDVQFAASSTGAAAVSADAAAVYFVVDESINF